jgi:hypothetical protein
MVLETPPVSETHRAEYPEALAQNPRHDAHTLYDTIGATYTVTRRTEPRSAAL